LHLNNLQQYIQHCPEDDKELYTKEIELTQKCLDAPNLPILINYKKENISPISQGDLKPAKALSN